MNQMGQGSKEMDAPEGSQVYVFIGKRFICLDFPSPQIPVLDDENDAFLLVQEDTFYAGISSPAFEKEKEGQTVFLASAVFQVPLTQYSQYARVAFQSGMF